ncbi:MAG: hypothetical protein HQK86_08270 [Nitrospinae bacterium]|nr:hypothetical protein [Nitrospinota bacterium]
MASKKHTPFISAILLLMSLAVLSGCGSGPGSDGLERKSGVSLNLTWPKGYSFDSNSSQVSSVSSPRMMSAPAYVTSCRVTISGPEMSPITLDVPLSSGQVSGSVTPGERNFSVVVETNIGLTFTGSTSATLVPGNNSGISIQLAVNAPPVATLAVSNLSPKPGEAVTLTVTVTDPDTSDVHTFAWDGGGGSVSGSGSTVTWVGTVPGDYTVSVIVRDGMGGMATLSAHISMINHPPVINSISSDKTTVKPGDVINLSCSATDPDNDPLTYYWENDKGWSAGGQNTSYTVGNLANPSVTITFTCIVSDGKPGGVVRRWLSVGAASSAPLASLFPDANLGACVVAAFPNATTTAQVTGSLDCSNKSISNLANIGYLTGLTWLALQSNQIVNVSPLSSLGGLTYLDLAYNSIATGVVSLSGLNSADIYLSGNPGMPCAALHTLICGTGNMVVGGVCAPASHGLGANVEISFNGIGTIDTPTNGVNCGGGTLQPPSTPVGVTALGGDAQVTVGWGNVLSATSYNIYWTTTPPVTTASAKIPGVASPHMHTGLTNGTPYYYAVTAENPVGESALSSQVSATPQAALPTAPTGLSAAGGNAMVTLTWNPVAGAISYNLYWTITPPVTLASNMIPVVVSPYNHITDINGVTFYYRVTAVNAAGEGPLSAQVNATTQAPLATCYCHDTLPGPPYTPINVTASGGCASPSIPTCGEWQSATEFIPLSVPGDGTWPGPWSSGHMVHPWWETGIPGCQYTITCP